MNSICQISWLPHALHLYYKKIDIYSIKIAIWMAMLPTNHVSNGFNCISQCTILQCSKPTEYFILFTGSFSFFFFFYLSAYDATSDSFLWGRTCQSINMTHQRNTLLSWDRKNEKKKANMTHIPPILIIATFYQQHEAKAKPTGNVFSHIFVTYPNFSDFFIFPPPDLHFIIKKHIIPLLRNSMIFFFILFSSYARFYQYFILNAS